LNSRQAAVTFFGPPDPDATRAKPSRKSAVIWRSILPTSSGSICWLNDPLRIRIGAPWDRCFGSESSIAFSKKARLSIPSQTLQWNIV
jgi:hypothetical protein